MTRLERIKKHEKEIDKLYKKIRLLQAKCKHKHVNKVPKGNTGNWCKSDDHYWYEIKCLDCDKFWTEPQ